MLDFNSISEIIRNPPVLLQRLDSRRREQKLFDGTGGRARSSHSNSNMFVCMQNATSLIFLLDKHSMTDRFLLLPRRTQKKFPPNGEKNEKTREKHLEKNDDGWESELGALR